MILVSGPPEPACLLVRRGSDHGPASGLSAQAMAPSQEVAAALLADLKAEMERLDVYRGQVIAIEMTRMGESRLAFLEPPSVDRADLVLPEGTLDRIERHVAGPTRHREALLDGRRHLSRGLLLWGPPGTGKTLTVRYLTGLLSEATIILLSGPSLGMVGAFGGLAPAGAVGGGAGGRRPRRRGALRALRRGGPVLFELMNEMSGLGEDADVAFVLTTNRPDALEPAVAVRPGRVDLAVEIPLPDEAARRALLDLYARGLDADIQDPGAVVARTEGMTASSFRELSERPRWRWPRRAGAG